MQSTLPTIEDYKAGKATVAAGLNQIDKWRWEGLQITEWRKDSQIDHDYYDGNQLNAQVLQAMEDRGIPAIVCNLIGPTIDLVLGTEAQMRSDWICRPDGADPRFDDMALALSQELHRAERMSGADEACSEAFANQIKGGIGWIEVKRETDPFKYPYSAAKRDWREFWVDPFSRAKDLDDARYLRRARYFDRDLLEKMFPAKAKQIHELNYGMTSILGSDRALTEAEMLSRGSMSPSRDYSLTDLDWLDLDRDRCQLEEFWYKVPVRGQVIRLPNGVAMEYRKDDAVQNMALERGLAELRSAVYHVMRAGFWIGPLCIQDIPSPYPHRCFPYVPFWGFREERTGVPYGLVRRMRAPQDEVNARRSKMLWGLSARRVYATTRAVADHDLARQEVARPDAYITVSDEQNQSFKVDDNIGVNDQQFQVYLDARQLLQDAGGVYQAQLGKEMTGQSGVAIANLVEQGSTTLAPMYANFRAGRTRVGQLLLSLVTQDIGQKQKAVVIEARSGTKRRVVLNEKVVDEQTGMETTRNEVARVKMNVVLDDVPSTPTFRMQLLQRVSEALRNLPPDAQLKLMDMVVELWDIPNKAEFVKRVREIAGAPPNPESMSPEELQAHEQQQKKAAQQEELMMRGVAAEVALKEGKAAEATAKAGATQAEAEAAGQITNAELRRMLADVQLIASTIRQKDAQTKAIEQDMVAQDMALAAGPPAKQVATYRW